MAENLDLTPCMFQTSEHFVLQKSEQNFSSMSLASTDIFRTVIQHLDFLISLQSSILVLPDGQWIVKSAYKEVFKFTPLLDNDVEMLRLCNPYLVIRNDNATVCRSKQTVRFSPESCSALLKEQIKEDISVNPLPQILALPKGKVFTYLEGHIASITFHNINSNVKNCVAIVDHHFQETIENVYYNTSVLMQQYENTIRTFFPSPNCQLLTFNLPDNFLQDLALYSTFPKSLALFLNRHTKFKSVCTVLGHNKTAENLPQQFEPTLKLFNQIFTSTFNVTSVASAPSKQNKFN